MLSSYIRHPFLQANVNNSSLVGIGYTQTLRPGKTRIYSNIQLNTLLNIIDFEFTRYIMLHFYIRYETHPLRTGGWEEYQCWWSQTGPGPGVGGMRICSAVSLEEKEYQLNLT